MDEYARRRNKTLTYYPDVARAGNLADALTSAFGEMGSSLTAYSPVPPDEPIWSPFSDHPGAPGMTVPEIAEVRAGGRHCQVRIAWFQAALGAFDLSFLFDGLYETDDRLVDRVGAIVTNDLGTAAHIIRRAFDDDAKLGELAREFGVIFRPPPRLMSSLGMEASVKRMLDRVYEKLNAKDPDEELAQHSGGSEKREDSEE